MLLAGSDAQRADAAKVAAAGGEDQALALVQAQRHAEVMGDASLASVMHQALAQMEPDIVDTARRRAATAQAGWEQSE